MTRMTEDGILYIPRAFGSHTEYECTDISSCENDVNHWPCVYHAVGDLSGYCSGGCTSSGLGNNCKLKVRIDGK